MRELNSHDQFTKFGPVTTDVDAWLIFPEAGFLVTCTCVRFVVFISLSMSSRLVSTL